MPWCGNGGGRAAEVMRADLKCILKAEIKELAHGYGYGDRDRQSATAPGFQLQHLGDCGSIRQDEKLGKGKRVAKRNKQHM